MSTQPDTRGLWNSSCVNMLIEAIFIKYGKVPRRMIGITLQQHSIKKWAYSLHISTQILK